MSSEKIVTCIGFDGNEYEVPESELIPRSSAYGIVIVKNSILLSKQSNGYDLPGGGLKKGEEDEEGLGREIFEETGLRVEVKNQVGEDVIKNFKYTHDDGRCIRDRMRYFEGNLVGGSISVSNIDELERSFIEGAEFYPLDKLGEITVASSNDWRPLVRQVAGL